ncbi:MAG: copper resistance protein CopC, partial [Beijerinckiaceae bacterium]|nr:copper resistance protein CopC [Beijerinckiaceae bacterium]
MNRRRRLLPPAAAILFLMSSPSPAAANVDRGGSGPALPPEVQTAGGVGPGFRPAKPLPGKNASPRLQFAHARVVRSFPESGAAVAPDAVGKVDVWYNEVIGREFVALAVINAAGDRVDRRDAAIDSADLTHVTVSVESLAPGEYTVRYRAVSADGHLASGAWV